MADRDAIAAANGVRFGLIGPLRVTNGSAACGQVTAAKQRTVLATLLLSCGHVISPDALADAVWDARVPPNAAAVMRTYVARLRHALGPAGGRIERRPGGWVLKLRGPEEFDVTEVEQLRSQSRAAADAGDWQRASSLLTRALSQWRGEPLADVPSSTLSSRERPRLEELRLHLTEARIDADLRLGRHNDVCDELRRLTWEQPLREHFHAQLMLAYYGSGQQAAALRVYRDARRILADELAVEPGPELQKINQQILTADPALVTSPPKARLTLPDGAVPRQVPADAAHFTGRADALRLLAEAGTLCLITGMPGAGKTALAVHWAHQVADRFPDGQLYVDLRGFDPREPLSTGVALAGFLWALGVRGSDIPPAVDERSSLLRSVLSGRRVLILLDNASSADQVRPLLPARADCMVIVTSRDALAGLVARDGASRVELGSLPPEEALALLRRLIGKRVDAELRSARRLAASCCGLPLAVRVAAEVAIARRDVPLSELADELADSQHALDALDAGGDARTAVREVLSWSYRRLDSTTARAFRLAGLHPGASWGSDAGAALIGTTRGDASRALGTL
ncbi:MAG TPA: BTAD domain-containing putative transcriptional regulator, partial [Streptosporangiaceae bacterium]|nr:BTAD domain-containing putative transcriptional regulator [Streptosporangiaceae bacterium]